MASAIASEGKDERWRLFADNFPLEYSGWPFGHVIAQMFYWSYTAQDNFRLWRQRVGI